MASESEESVIVTQNKWNNFRRISVVFGGILVHLTLGTLYSYGNLAPYFVSYMRAVGASPDLTYKEAAWIFAATAAGQGLFGGIGGILDKKLGPRLTILIGCSLVSGGVALTNISIRHGFFYLLITYGGMFGSGIGIAYYIPIGCAMRWFPKRKSFIAGFVVSGFGGGAFIFNQVITAFVNPHNLAPDLEIDHNFFFSQPEVLNNVPKCLLLLAGIYITMQIIGCLLIYNPPEIMTLKVVEENLELSTIDKTIEEAAQNEKTRDGGLTSDKKVTEKEVRQDMTPLQMLKTKTFYHLWFLLFFNNHVVTVISTLYKAYGQTFIRDDYFLSLVGAFASICNACGRILWGLLADRTSFQIAQMCLTTSLSCLFSMFNISEIGGKPVFFIFVCLIFLSFSGIYSTFPSITMRCFGSTYYSANFGIICTALAGSNISTSFLAHVLYEHIGYHGLFFVASGLSLTGCLLAFLFQEPENIA